MSPSSFFLPMHLHVRTSRKIDEDKYLSKCAYADTFGPIIHLNNVMAEILTGNYIVTYTVLLNYMNWSQL